MATCGFHIISCSRLKKVALRLPMGSCYCVRIWMKKVAVALPVRWQWLCIATELTNDQ